MFFIMMVVALGQRSYRGYFFLIELDRYVVPILLCIRFSERGYQDKKEILMENRKITEVFP